MDFLGNMLDLIFTLFRLFFYDVMKERCCLILSDSYRKSIRSLYKWMSN